MPLIVETGELIAGANSYATVQQIQSHAQLRGLTLPSDDASIERLAIKAMDYIEAQERYYQGVRVAANQALSWPRIGVILHDHAFPATDIPNELVQAQSALSAVINTGVDMLPTRTKPLKKSVRVGPIATDYAIELGAGGAPVVAAVDALLAPLFTQTSGLKVVRV